jgi:hypothetical protein
MKAVRWSVVVPWVLTVGLFVALVGTAAVGGAGIDGGAELVAVFGIIGLWGLANATVGAIIVTRRPGNRIGRILQAGGPLIIGAFMGFLISAIQSVSTGPGDQFGALAGWWAGITVFPARGGPG